MTPQGWLITGLMAVLLLMLVFVSSAVLMPFVAGLVLAYVLAPLVERLHGWGLPRSLAAALPVAVAIVVLGVALAFVLPLLVNQLTAFVQKLPTYIQQLQQSLLPIRISKLLNLKAQNPDLLVNMLGSFGTQGASWLTANLARVYSGAMAVFNVLMLVIMTPLVAFYLMHDWPHLNARVLRVLPRTWRPTFTEMLEKTDHKLSGYLRGQLMVCTLLAVFYGTALHMTGLELGWALGVMAGFLAFIPVVGAMVAVLAMLAMALVQYQLTGWEPYAVIMGIYAIGQLVESAVLTPLLVGNRVGLHPVWVVFVLLVGGQVAGITGMLLAIPVAIMVGVVLPYIIQAWHKTVST